MPTLHWLLQESTLNNLRLLTGISHTEQAIRSVNVLDNPDVLKWFKRDELILTTGFVFKDDPELQRTIIRDMKEIGCAALGVKIRRFFRSIPEPLLEEAEKLDFPVIELPFFYGFAEISQQIFQQIYQENQKQPQREQDFLFQFMNDVLHHAPLADLLQQLAAYLDHPALLLDISYAPLILSSALKQQFPTAEQLANMTGALSRFALEKPRSPMLTIQQQDYFLQLLRLPNQTGYLCILHTKNDFSDLTDAFLQKILQLLALAYEQNNIPRISYENRSSFFLHFLMHQEKANQEETQNLCAFYGFDYLKAWICLTLSLQDIPAKDKPPLLQSLHKLMPQYVPNKAAIFLCANDHLFCCFFLFPLHCHRLHALHEVQKAADALQKRLAAIIHTPILMGISGCHANVSDIRQSLQESLQSMNLQQQLQLTGPGSYLQQLPSHLLAAYGKNTGRILKHNLLKPLLDFDQKSHSDLTYTLQVYFACNYNASAAAKRLYLHRNTMLHRLEKIKELLDVDFSDAQENFLLYLGLLALKLTH